MLRFKVHLLLVHTESEPDADCSLGAAKSSTKSSMT